MAEQKENTTNPTHTISISDSERKRITLGNLGRKNRCKNPLEDNAAKAADFLYDEDGFPN
jgi:hypothetical protein